MQKKHLIGAGITAFSVILGLLWLIPLIWLIGTAFSVPSFHMTLFPTTAFTLDNIKYVWNAIPFGTYYINTLTLVVCTFAVQFFTSTLAAYALAVLDFKGQALVFAVIFMQIIIPNDVLITPNFMTLSDLKLIDTKIGMMLPFYGSAMAIFLLRQHFKSLKPQRSTVPTHGRPSGVYTCPVQNRHIFPLPLSLSATTGTTICGL